MNWDAIGAVGEIVGAIAVVATLFFLAIQVRTSNAIAAAERRDKAFEHNSRWRQLMASDADVARIWRLGCLGESLTEDEEFRFDQIAREHFLIWRMSFERAKLAGQPSLVPENTLVRSLQDPKKPALLSKWREFNADAPAEDEFSKRVEKMLTESGT